MNSNDKKKLLILSVCQYSGLWMMIAQLDVVGCPSVDLWHYWLQKQ